jgi:hypothetical protein
MRTTYPGLFTLLLIGFAGCAPTEEASVDCGESVINPCPVPWVPDFQQLHLGAEWTLETSEHGLAEVGVSAQLDAEAPGSWVEAQAVSFDELGSVQVFTRYADMAACASEALTRLVEVVETYAPAASQPGSTAIYMEHPVIRQWASEVVDVAYGLEVDENWRQPAAALGPAEGSPSEVLVLGEGGEVSLGFERPIRNGAGADFVVFENGTTEGFLELAFVEVSTDGENFIRFPSAYLGEEPLGTFGVHSPTLISGLAGKYLAGFGTPFDLEVLTEHPMVQDGLVDLQRIEQLRIVDVVGDGSMLDSFGMPIYDPYPSVGTAGFDVDAVGVINALPSVCME